MRYDLVLMDADETLFDFKIGQRRALKESLLTQGVELTDDLYIAYNTITAKLWSAVERGELSIAEVFSVRFELFFTEIGVIGDPVKANDMFLEVLGKSTDLISGALDLCKFLKKSVRTGIVTNGDAKTQKRRFFASDLAEHVDFILVSEEIGVSKPDSAIFREAMRLADFSDKFRTLFIGDNPSADIAGALNFGIDACWYNPRNKTVSGLHPTHIVSSLAEILPIITAH